MDTPNELAARALMLESPQGGLAALGILRRRLGVLEELHVRNAREAGLSWSQIARPLGVTKQALHKKYATQLNDSSPEPAGDLSKAQVVVTTDARRAVRYAREEARARGHFPVGTGHLLLGLMRDPTAAPAGALEECGITMAALREQVDWLLGAVRGPEADVRATPVSRAARRAFEQALREAIRLGDGHLGTEHVLLGVLREQRGAGAQALATLGTSAAEVESALLDALGRREEGGASDAVPNLAS